MIIKEYTLHRALAFGVAFSPADGMMLGVIVRDAEAGRCSLTVAQRPSARTDGFVHYTFPELAMAPAAAYELCLHHVQESCSPQDYWARLVADLPADVEDPVVECPARPCLPRAMGLKNMQARPHVRPRGVSKTPHPPRH